jgi:hypothetical protein
MNDKSLLIQEITNLLPMASFAMLEFVFYMLIKR